MNEPAGTKRIVVGVTGASGALYAKRLIECLVEAGAEVHLVVSSWGRKLFLDELGIATIDADSLLDRAEERLVIHPVKALDSKLASGSFHTDGMIVCPCSSHTLGEMAAGIGDSLIARAAAVTLKEARRLIIVPREMPISRIDLLNMLRLNEAGAIICPANPGFYMLPNTVDDLVDFVVGKLLDLTGVPHQLNTRWSPPGKEAEGETSEAE
jgi:4-hydroxy-3-polyprenylbenzoate decarboxylase